MLAAAVLGLAASASVFSFEIYTDYTPSTEIWNVTFVRVNPNRLDDYLAGLKQTWVNSCEIQKKMGMALECFVYASDTMANTDFNLLLVTKIPNAGITDPNKARYDAFMAELRLQLAEDKENKLVEGYDELRKFFGEQNFRRLTFK
jgi:hypothetical protein